MRTLLAVGWLAAFALAPTGSDADAASLGGRVTDETATAVRAATISARNVFSREVYIAKTDTEGFYKFDSLRHGRYSVFASAEGHHCRWVLNVFLHAGKHATLDLVLTRCSSGVPCRECGETESVRHENRRTDFPG